MPALGARVRARARLWVRDPIDEPGPYSGFGAEFIGEKAYAEMLVAGLSIDQCSAVAAIWCGEQRPVVTFGKLDNWRDLRRLEEPRQRELGELDAVLTNTLKVADLSWRGGKPFLEAEGVAIALEEHVTAHLASELALAVGRQAATPAPVSA